jgi:hypothetical protein
VKEVWDHLGMATIIQDACNSDRDGSSVLGSLLSDKTSTTMLAEVTRAELISGMCGGSALK